MNIAGRDKNSYTIIDIAGRINKLKDVVTLKAFVKQLLTKKISRIALNLHEVTYLDSGAITVLIYCHNTLSQLGGALALIAPSPYVRDILSVVGLDKIVTIYSTEEDFEHETTVTA